MAYQHADKRKGAPINRTSAPDEVTQIRSPQGGQGYGQNAPQPSSVGPGKSVESALASNLRDSQKDSEDVLSQVIEKGVAGRGDAIPADGDDLQLRAVSDKMYPPSHGHVRQQDPDKVFGKASLAASETNNQTQPVRRPS
jgi:hypothetical protein